MVLSSDPRQNHLLAALPEAEWARWQPHLELAKMPLGKVLYESGGKLGHVYFPTTSIVSLLYVMEDGASAEISVVGHDGVVGVSVFMGGESTTSRRQRVRKVRNVIAPDHDSPVPFGVIHHHLVEGRKRT